MKTLNIYDQRSKGSLQFVRPRKNSKFIRVMSSIDGYGFIVEIPKEDLEELLK